MATIGTSAELPECLTDRSDAHQKSLAKAFLKQKKEKRRSLQDGYCPCNSRALRDNCVGCSDRADGHGDGYAEELIVWLGSGIEALQGFLAKRGS